MGEPLASPPVNNQTI